MSLVPVITRLVNSSLSIGIVPTAFKSALLTPLLRKPSLDGDILKNYRPVSNLPYLSKVLEKIVLSRLLNFLEESGQHEPHQSAYRSAHSTETALVRVSSDILSALDRREGFFLVFLDLSAAFATIDRELMLNSLLTIGVEGTALNLFSSYLQDRHQSVSISGSTSKSMCLRFAVPHESFLGQFLFTQYTVAIGKICGRQEVGYQLHADDTQVYNTLKVDSIINQQTALARIQACIEEIRI